MISYSKLFIILLYFYTISVANKPLTSFEGHAGNVVAIGFQYEDKWLYSGSEDGSIKLWDMRNVVCQRDYKCGAPVNSLSLHPNQGDIISGDENGYLKLWDLTADKVACSVQPDGREGIRSVSVSGDGKRCVCATSKGDVFLYEIKRSESVALKLVKKIKAHNSYILKAQISPNAKYVILFVVLWFFVAFLQFYNFLFLLFHC